MLANNKAHPAHFERPLDRQCQPRIESPPLALSYHQQPRHSSSATNSTTITAPNTNAAIHAGAPIRPTIANMISSLSSATPKPASVSSFYRAFSPMSTDHFSSSPEPVLEPKGDQDQDQSHFPRDQEMEEREYAIEELSDSMMDHCEPRRGWSSSSSQQTNSPSPLMACIPYHVPRAFPDGVQQQEQSSRQHVRSYSQPASQSGRHSYPPSYNNHHHHHNNAPYHPQSSTGPLKRISKVSLQRRPARPLSIHAEPTFSQPSLPPVEPFTRAQPRTTPTLSRTLPPLTSTKSLQDRMPAALPRNYEHMSEAQRRLYQHHPPSPKYTANDSTPSSPSSSRSSTSAPSSPNGRDRGHPSQRQQQQQRYTPLALPTLAHQQEQDHHPYNSRPHPQQQQRHHSQQQHQERQPQQDRYSFAHRHSSQERPQYDRPVDSQYSRQRDQPPSQHSHPYPQRDQDILDEPHHSFHIEHRQQQQQQHHLERYQDRHQESYSEMQRPLPQHQEQQQQQYHHHRPYSSQPPSQPSRERPKSMHKQPVHRPSSVPFSTSGFISSAVPAMGRSVSDSPPTSSVPIAPRPASFSARSGTGSGSGGGSGLTVHLSGTEGMTVLRHDDGSIMVYNPTTDAMTFRCELCPDESFGRIHDLKRHQTSKHQEMTWPCDFCHRPFVRRDALLRHYTVKAARDDGLHPATHEVDKLLAARARAKRLC